MLILLYVSYSYRLLSTGLAAGETSDPADIGPTPERCSSRSCISEKFAGSNPSWRTAAPLEGSSVASD